MVEASVGRRAPLGPRFIIIVVGLILFILGLIGLIGLVTRDGSFREPFPRDCPTLEPGVVTVARCVEFPLSTGP